MSPRKGVSNLAAVAESTGGDLSHSIVWIPVAQLSFEPKYNRAVNERRVAKIADEFDPDFIGTITVSQRPDNIYVVIDGQHRIRALRQMGWADQSVECRVYSGLSLAAEAKIFRGLNTMSKPQAIDMYRSRVVEGESIAAAIDQIIQAAGFTVRLSSGAGAFAAVAAAERIYTGRLVRKDGLFPNELRGTLRVLTQAFGATSDAVNGFLLEGVALVFFRYGSGLQIPALTSKMAAYPGGPQGLIGQAKSLQQFRGGTLPDNMAEVIVGIYNKSRRTGALPDWRAS